MDRDGEDDGRPGSQPVDGAAERRRRVRERTRIGRVWFIAPAIALLILAWASLTSGGSPSTSQLFDRRRCDMTMRASQTLDAVEVVRSENPPAEGRRETAFVTEVAVRHFPGRIELCGEAWTDWRGEPATPTSLKVGSTVFVDGIDVHPVGTVPAGVTIEGSAVSWSAGCGAVSRCESSSGLVALEGRWISGARQTTGASYIWPN